MKEEILDTVRKIGKAIVKYKGMEFLLCRKDIYKIEVKRDYKAVPVEELKRVDNLARYLAIKFMFNKVFGENRIGFNLQLQGGKSKEVWGKRARTKGIG